MSFLISYGSAISAACDNGSAFSIGASTSTAGACCGASSIAAPVVCSEATDYVFGATSRTAGSISIGSGSFYSYLSCKLAACDSCSHASIGTLPATSGLGSAISSSLWGEGLGMSSCLAGAASCADASGCSNLRGDRDLLRDLSGSFGMSFEASVGLTERTVPSK